MEWGLLGQDAALKAKAAELEAKELYIRRLEARLLAQHKLLQRRSHNPASLVSLLNPHPDDRPSARQPRADDRHGNGFPVARATTPAAVRDPFDQAQAHLRRDAAGASIKHGVGDEALVAAARWSTGSRGPGPSRPAAGPVYYVLNPLADEDFQEAAPASPLRPPLRAPLRNAVPPDDGAPLRAHAVPPDDGPPPTLGGPPNRASCPAAPVTKARAPPRAACAQVPRDQAAEAEAAAGPSVPARRWDPDVWTPPRQPPWAEAQPPKARQRPVPLRRSLPAALPVRGSLRHPSLHAAGHAGLKKAQEHPRRHPAKESGGQEGRPAGDRALVPHLDLTGLAGGYAGERGAGAEVPTVPGHGAEPPSPRSLDELEERIAALTSSSQNKNLDSAAFGNPGERGGQLGIGGARRPLAPTSRGNARSSAPAPLAKSGAAAQGRTTAQRGPRAGTVASRNNVGREAEAGAAREAASDLPQGHVDSHMEREGLTKVARVPMSSCGQCVGDPNDPNIAGGGRTAEEAAGAKKPGLTAFIMSARNARKSVQSLGLRPVARGLPPPPQVPLGPASQPPASPDVGAARPPLDTAGSPWGPTLAPDLLAQALPEMQDACAPQKGAVEGPGVPGGPARFRREDAGPSGAAEVLGSREEPTPRLRLVGSEDLADVIIMEEQLGSWEGRVGSGRHAEARALEDPRNMRDVVLNGFELRPWWEASGLDEAAGEQGPCSPSVIAQDRTQAPWSRLSIARGEPAGSPGDRCAAGSRPGVVIGQAWQSRQQGSVAYNRRGLHEGWTLKPVEAGTPQGSPRLSEALRDCQCDASFLSHSHDVFSSA